MSNLPADASADAARVLQTFLDAGMRHDEETMKACVTRGTLESGNMKADASPEGATCTMGRPQPDGEGFLIPVALYQPDTPPGGPPMMELPCLMVREEGQWKFDLGASMERLLGGSLEQIAGAMAGAMEGIGQAIADGFREAFGPSGEQTEGDDAAPSDGDPPADDAEK
ncbi:MAG: hypothetical protein BIFFINMI_00262 [Phycisphaerae bacterium]|nr:hypothetical protein [Phycisphaerae bacterium]